MSAEIEPKPAVSPVRLSLRRRFRRRPPRRCCAGLRCCYLCTAGRPLPGCGAEIGPLPSARTSLLSAPLGPAPSGTRRNVQLLLNVGDSVGAGGLWPVQMSFILSWADPQHWADVCTVPAAAPVCLGTLLSRSRSDAWLFIASFSLEPLPWCHSLFSFLSSTCVRFHSSACYSLARRRLS